MILACFLLVVAACGNSGSRNAAQDKIKTEASVNAVKAAENRVEVLSFHAKQRCATCIAIEQNTESLLKEKFADRIKNGTLVFKVIDISEKENEAIAEKYEVTWSSLFVVTVNGGEEKAENLTEMAFAKARTAPETFKSELEGKVNSALAQLE